MQFCENHQKRWLLDLAEVRS